MDIILDNIFLIILLLVGAVSQWLKARGEAQQEQPPHYDPTELEEMIEEEERRRSRPAVPPPLPPAAFPQPSGNMTAPAPSLRRKSREPEPATFDTSSELARQQELAEKLREMKRTRGARQFNESLIPRRNKLATAGPAVAATGLKARLANRVELRQAFVLKEILEKPVGLR